MAKPLKLYWSRSKPNFGDALSPLICEAVSARKIIYARPSRCDLVAIGSLMHRFKERRFSHITHVWGTGFLSDEPARESRHIYHAVRGRLTQEIVCPERRVALGDPGLLANLLLPTAVPHRKTSKIGLVEHYKDRGNRTVQAIAAHHRFITVIDIFAPPREFLAQLAACEVIFSSAMHGLVAADALQIPNAWMKLSDQLRGGDFKFRDYYSVFNMAPHPVDLAIDNVQQIAESIADDYRRAGLAEIKKHLLDAFPYDL